MLGPLLLLGLLPGAVATVVGSASSELCVQLPPAGHSQRGVVAAEELLLDELRRRASDSGGVSAGGGNRAEAWISAVTCPASVPTISLDVVGDAAPAVCGLELGSGTESFVLCGGGGDGADSSLVSVTARSDRGLMLGIGRLLREISVTAAGVVALPTTLTLSVTPPPFGRMRGHQLTDWGFYMTTPA